MMKSLSLQTLRVTTSHCLWVFWPNKPTRWKKSRIWRKRGPLGDKSAISCFSFLESEFSPGTPHRDQARYSISLGTKASGWRRKIRCSEEQDSCSLSWFVSDGIKAQTSTPHQKGPLSSEDGSTRTGLRICFFLQGMNDGLLSSMPFSDAIAPMGSSGLHRQRRTPAEEKS